MEQTHRFPAWFRLAAACSGTAYTVLLMQTESKLSFLVTAIAALILLMVFSFRTPLLEKLFAPRGWGLWVLAGVLSIAAVYTAKSTFFSNCWTWMHKLIGLLGLPREDLVIRGIPWLVALAALPMAFGYFLWFVDFFRKLGLRLWRESDFTERLFFLGAGLLFAMMIVFAFMCTQAFYGAHVNGNWFNFDLIYSADSGYLVHQDVYRNVGAEQNDLRQPLYGAFAMPFAQVAWLISKVLFFLPESYITVWQIMQMLLFLVAVVLVGRMLGLKGAEKALFLTMLCVCYPTLIFVLTAEQYLTSVFYLVLLLYLEREPVGQSLAYIGATGSLLTSGIWFPLITWDRSFRKFVKKTAMLCGAFFSVTILSGRLTTFLDIPTYIEGYGYYTGADVPLLSKLMQYVNFAGACLLAPPSGQDLTTYRHISWQMLPVENWSVVGIVVLVLALAGIVVGRKKRFTKICAVWIGFSFLLLGLIGWGTIDNGLMLYSLYFGWAFAAMIVQWIDWVFHRLRPVKLAALMGLTLLLGICNVWALRDVLVFGTQFFPALGG